MNKEYKTLTGTTILFAGSNIIGKLLKILLVPLYTYCLTSSEFGTGETITLTVNLLYPILLLGVSEAAVRFIMKEEHSFEDIAANCLTVLLASSLAGMLLIIPLSHLKFLHGYMAVMYIMISAAALERLLMAEAKGLGKNVDFAVSEIISAGTLIASSIIMLAVLKAGVGGYLWSIAAASLARIVFLSFRLQVFRFVRRGTVSKSMISSLLKFSLPFMPATILWWVMDSSGRYMVMWFIGSSAAGIYAVAFRLSAMVNGISAVFHQAWQLSAIRQYSAGDYELFYKSAVRLYSTLFFLGTSVLILLAKPLVLLLDDSYLDAWRYTPLLLISAVFFALSGFVNANYYVYGHTSGVLLTSLCGATAAVISGVMLTPSMGMQGAAAASLISFYVLWLLMSVHTGKLLGFSHEYLMIHIDLLIMLAETVTVLRTGSPLAGIGFPLLLLIINRKTIADMLRGAADITKVKTR